MLEGWWIREDFNIIGFCDIILSTNSWSNRYNILEIPQVNEVKKEKGIASGLSK